MLCIVACGAHELSDFRLKVREEAHAFRLRNAFVLMYMNQVVPHVVRRG